MNDIALANWVFERDGQDWIGRCTVNGRRTALKGSLQAAQQDAATGRAVCRDWAAAGNGVDGTDIRQSLSRLASPESIAA